MMAPLDVSVGVKEFGDLPRLTVGRYHICTGCLKRELQRVIDETPEPPEENNHGEASDRGEHGDD